MFLAVNNILYGLPEIVPKRLYWQIITFSTYNLLGAVTMGDDQSAT